MLKFARTAFARARPVGNVGDVGDARNHGCGLEQPAGHVWTQQEVFRRNDVGSREEQTTAFTPPHKVIANIYYVGTQSLASFLVTTPRGHILINSSYKAEIDIAEGVFKQVWAEQSGK